MQFFCLRRCTRNAGFASGVDSACVSLRCQFWNVADDGASCRSASARSNHVESSRDKSNWTYRGSTCHQQSSDSSSSERHCEAY